MPQYKTESGKPVVVTAIEENIIYGEILRQKHVYFDTFLGRYVEKPTTVTFWNIREHGIICNIPNQAFNLVEA